MPTERFTQTIHGFAVHGLRSETAELTVCPELGMRVIDFIDRRTGRRWFWGPPRGTSGLPNLFRNRPGDPFDESPLLGLDECLPSVHACPTGPDHGEVWPRATTLIDDAPGTVRTRVSLPGCGLDFERAVTLDPAGTGRCFRIGGEDGFDAAVRDQERGLRLFAHRAIEIDALDKGAL